MQSAGSPACFVDVSGLMLGKGFVSCFDWLVARILDSSTLSFLPPPPTHNHHHDYDYDYDVAASPVNHVTSCHVLSCHVIVLYDSAMSHCCARLCYVSHVTF